MRLNHRIPLLPNSHGMLLQRFELISPPLHHNLLGFLGCGVIHKFVSEYDQPIFLFLGRCLQKPEDKVEDIRVHLVSVFEWGVGVDGRAKQIELLLEDTVVGLLGDVVYYDFHVLAACELAVFYHVEEGFPD